VSSHISAKSDTSAAAQMAARAIKVTRAVQSYLNASSLARNNVRQLARVKRLNQNMRRASKLNDPSVFHKCAFETKNLLLRQLLANFDSIQGGSMRCNTIKKYENTYYNKKKF
jgi:hypothetical protein